jgi:Arc/MetJ-type ribon-helix-helix transcriptional regulator
VLAGLVLVQVAEVLSDDLRRHVLDVLLLVASNPLAHLVDEDVQETQRADQMSAYCVERARNRRRNVRVSEQQAAWLRNVAEARHSGNLSEAVRQAVTDSWMLRRAREEYKELRAEGFEFPRDEDGMTRGIELFLSWELKNSVWDDDDAARI